MLLWSSCLAFNILLSGIEYWGFKNKYNKIFIEPFGSNGRFYVYIFSLLELLVLSKQFMISSAKNMLSTLVRVIF